MRVYADLILPLPLDSLFTYEVPSKMRNTVKEGVRAVVHFGTKKYYTGIVRRVYEAKKKEGIKEIVSLLEDYPIVLPSQLEHWEWIANYYLCTLGDVYKAALPSSFRLESKTYVFLNVEYDPNHSPSQSLTANEKRVFELLSSTKSNTIATLEKNTEIINVLAVVKSLSDKGVARLSETVEDQYIAKTEIYVRLARSFSDEELNEILDSLSRAKKQEELLRLVIEESLDKKDLLRKDLLEKADCSSAVLNELLKKEILELYEQEVSRFNYGDINLEAAYEPNPHQEIAYKEINKSFEEKNITLLYGVTSSGKTEIYIRLIKDMITEGKQVLYLLPEIALTTQITGRLKRIFGNSLAVYHSKFNDNERVDIWNKLLEGNETKVVLGARSAVFLPFNNLGLVIVDEEHEGSYKQQDPAPRYHARNSAIVLANALSAKTLLGTATPAMETYYNALAGRYGLVSLSKRHEEIALPEIRVIDTKDLRRKKLMKSVLSPDLIEYMTEALQKEEQIILFQNRRGFSSLIECKACAWTLYCEHCDVSLTYHKRQNVMSCHYCGAGYSVPTACPDCKTDSLELLGYGTERIEEEVKELFSEARIARMDLDTTRGKRSYERIISDFENGRSNILIGTQMVSKGLDFDNVSVVGILNADNQLNYPDFRAHEKAFQLMVQVSGRSGRKNKRGLVILQTAQPQHSIIKFVCENDYTGFFDMQLSERRLFHYPPFYRLIEITLRARQEQRVDAAARYMGQSLKASFGNRVLGPTRPAISRMQSLHIRKILLKIEVSVSIQQVREAIKHHQAVMQNDTNYRSVLLHFDVDPV